MNLQALASKPQLIEIKIEDEAIVEKYKDIISFWIYDRQDMDTFMKLASLDGDVKFADLSKVVEGMILDEEGNKILVDGNQLPADVMIKVVNTVVGTLGN